ncbi:MAG TPA: isochorismate synthase [Candidatus Baltobacteraceae bacterium]|jgi:menaquinone-specific isochorismate synthase|nr:isochorismate synthase [Candidatus Baltobacteraceae bacterium]
MGVIPECLDVVEFLHDSGVLHDVLARIRRSSDGNARLATLSVRVPRVDPLSVLARAGGRARGYWERPSVGEAYVGFGAAITVQAGGDSRFGDIRAAFSDVRSHLCGLDGGAPAAPQVFTRFAFSGDLERARPFAPAHAEIPSVAYAASKDYGTIIVSAHLDAEVDFAQLANEIVTSVAIILSADRRFEVSSDVSGFSEVGGTLVSYPERMRATIAAIQRGEFEKLVLSAYRDLSFEETIDPLGVLSRARGRYPECMMFGVFDSDCAFVGATPEWLIRCNETTIVCDALAGSIWRGRTSTDDLLLAESLATSTTFRHEHRLVVDEIVRRLRHLDLDPMFAAEPSLRRFANIQHLFTEIRASRPKNFHVLDAVAMLHPTPAVGCMPYAAVDSAYARFEGFPRGLYAGPIGWFDLEGSGQFAVALRSALIDGKRARLYAGNGIVAESDPEHEMCELDRKFRPMFDALHCVTS